MDFLIQDVRGGLRVLTAEPYEQVFERISARLLSE